MAGKNSGTWGASNGVAVTPGASTIPTTRALFVGTGGNLELTFADGGAGVVLKNVASGSIVPVQVTKVTSANTTATDIVALY